MYTFLLASMKVNDCIWLKLCIVTFVTADYSAARAACLSAFSFSIFSRPSRLVGYFFGLPEDAVTFEALRFILILDLPSKVLSWTFLSKRLNLFCWCWALFFFSGSGKPFFYKIKLLTVAKSWRYHFSIRSFLS